jgi:hypothetical protein
VRGIGVAYFADVPGSIKAIHFGHMDIHQYKIVNAAVFDFSTASSPFLACTAATPQFESSLRATIALIILSSANKWFCYLIYPALQGLLGLH